MDSQRLRFGDFEIDPLEATLRRSDVPVKLRPQAFRILFLLASNPGRLVTRERIRQEIWGPDTFVDFNQGLNVCIRQIRDALGDDPDQPRFIETIPKLGYRFIAPSTLDDAAPAPATTVSSAVITAPEVAPGQVPSPEQPSGGPAPRVARGRLPLVAAAAVVLIAAVALAFATKQRSVEAAPPAIRSVAVLPLANGSADPAQEFLADGMTDALINDLAQIGALKVISRTSVTRYKGTATPLPDIARELHVDAIVEGSVHREQGRVRVNVRLVHAATDHHVWAQTYERSVDDVLTLQREIAKAVAIAIRAVLTPEERSRLALAARPTDPLAFEAYLRGRHNWNDRSAAGLERAIHYFKDAIERDPEYAAAYAGLADSYVLGPGLRTNAAETYSLARAAAAKALELDDTLAEAHSALGLVHLFFDWNLPAAGERFRRAIDLNRGYASARQSYAEYLGITGQLGEAMIQIEKARELDPLSLSISRDVARVHYLAGRYDRAIRELRKTLEADDTFQPARFLLAFAYDRAGRHRDALAECERLVASSGGRPLMKAALGYMYGIAGNHVAARRILDELAAQKSESPSYNVALVHLGLGNRDGVFDWLTRAVDERSYRVVYLAADPIFDDLASDARFAPLLERIGLPSVSPPASGGE